jgi:hypothetical protein
MPIVSTIAATALRHGLAIATRNIEISRFRCAADQFLADTGPERVTRGLSVQAGLD